MSATIDQLIDLTERYNARRAEFDVDMGGSAAHVFEPVSLGEVRMFADVFAEWQAEQEIEQAEEDEPNFDDGYKEGFDEGVRQAVAGTVGVWSNGSVGWMGLRRAEPNTMTDPPAISEDSNGPASATTGDDPNLTATLADAAAIASLRREKQQVWREAGLLDTSENEPDHEYYESFGDAIGYPDGAPRPPLDAFGQAVEDAERQMSEDAAIDAATGISDDDWCGPEDDDPADLAADWPTMPDLTGGVARLAQHPVAGEPEQTQAEFDERIAEDGRAAKAAIDEIAVRESVRRLSPQAAAPGPEHTVVTPLADRPIGRDRTQPHKHPWKRRVDGRPNSPLPASRIQPDPPLAERINNPRVLEEVDAANDIDDDLDLDDVDLDDEPHGRRYKTSEDERRRAKQYRDRQRRDHPAEPREPKGKRGNVLPTLNELIAEVQRISMDKKTMPTLAQFDDARPANWATAGAQLARLGISWEQLRIAAGLKPNPRAAARQEA